MNSKPYSLTILTIALTLLCFSCGGESGSGPEQSPDSPPITPPSSSAALDANNGIDAAIYAIAKTESLLETSQLLIPFMFDDRFDTSVVLNEFCGKAGTVRIDYADADNSGFVSVSDTFEFAFDKCQLNRDSQTISGNASVAVVSVLGPDNIGVDIGLSLNFSDKEGFLAFASNQIRFEYNESDTTEDLDIRSVQDVATVSFESSTEILESFNIQYSVLKDTQEYAFNFDINATSQAFDTGLSCVTGVINRGTLFQDPSQYSYQCSANANNENFVDINKNQDDELTTVSLFNEAGLQETVQFDHNKAFEGNYGSPVIDKEEYLFARSMKTHSAFSYRHW
ncbi:MAG: hypothetical protein AAGJ37_02045 [Pseudomonadota bacterium]